MYDQNNFKGFINIDEFRYVRYFIPLSLEHSTFESPSLMQLFVGIRHRGIACERESVSTVRRILLLYSDPIHPQPALPMVIP